MVSGESRAWPGQLPVPQLCRDTETLYNWPLNTFLYLRIRMIENDQDVINCVKKDSYYMLYLILFKNRTLFQGVKISRNRKSLSELVD